MTTQDKKLAVIEVFELFTFKDGIRYAYVTYQLYREGCGERHPISVREVK